MKNLATITLFLLGVLAISGCQSESGGTAKEKAKTSESTEAKKTPATTESAKPKEESKAEATLKVEDIDHEKPFSATELNASFKADEASWKGKEVSVVGKYHSTTSSKVDGKDRIRIDIADEKTNKKVAGCVVKAKPAEDMAANRMGRVFKGTIAENRYGRVLIEPCEVVK